MSSNGKSTLSGDSRSEKPKGVESDSFLRPIKPTGTPYVSSGLLIGDPNSKKAKGEASVSSGLTKPTGKTDYVGHIKLVNEQVLSDSLVLDDAEIASSRRVLLHVQTHDGPVMKLYLWDKATSDFSEKIKASGGTARVILVTTLNPKRFGGALALSSMMPSRVILDSDVQATRDYLTWLNSNLAVANRVDADVVTKTETVTIGELFTYMKQEAAKVVAWFECIATIGDVAHGSAWYYIGCARISVYDNDDQASFVLLGDAGHELTGKRASELVESYFEANESVGDDHLVPASNHNLIAKTQTLTVTNVLLLEAPEHEGKLGENVDEEPDNEREDHADESVKRGADGIESEGAKRAKCG
ncbi:unnamed protein product [Brassica oleracea]